MTANKTWILTTSGDRPLDDIARDAQQKGFDIGSILEEIGCITGKAEDDTAERLRDIAGVTDVSPDPEIDIGPPDAEETW